MNCDEVEKKIISGEVDTVAREHIEHCANCRGFSSFYSVLLECPDIEEEKIPGLHGIIKVSAERKRRKFKLMDVITGSGIAACASAVLLTFAVQYWNIPEKHEKLIDQENDYYKNFYQQQISSYTDVTTQADALVSMSWDDGSVDNIQYLLADAASPWQIEAYNPFILEY